MVKLIVTIVKLNSYRESSGVVEYASLPDAIQKLQKSVDVDSSLVLEVRRSHIVKDALREARTLKFTTTKLAKVSICIVMSCKDDMIVENLFSQIRFVGEGAVDHGGPRREFFCLLAISLSWQSQYMTTCALGDVQESQLASRLSLILHCNML